MQQLVIMEVLAIITITCWSAIRLCPTTDSSRVSDNPGTGCHDNKKTKAPDKFPAVALLSPAGSRMLEHATDILNHGYKDVALSLRVVGDTSVGYVTGFVS